MRARWLGVLAVLTTLAPVTALAVDAPHDGSATNGTCEACHKTHNAVGGTLLNQPDNNTACTACHNDPASTLNQPRLGLPWSGIDDQAVPGKSGAQHRWDALADSPAFGAAAPTDTEMLKRIKDGRIQCAACHNVHTDVKAFDPSALHTSIAAGTNTAVTGGTAGMGMTLTAPAAAAVTRGYRLYISAAATNQLGLSISHDAKTTAGASTWYVNNGGGWIPGPQTGGTQRWATGAAVTLDDSSVVVTFTGTPVVGQFWDFYVSYAHLRASNVADALCLQCHAARNQSHTTVEGPGNGTTLFSHPVGVTLNINTKGYDRAAASVLDANGAIQTPGDGNPTNNLTLDGGTTVRCTTCHNVHNADSNSLTVDPR